jgi:hypothetical protein
MAAASEEVRLERSVGGGNSTKNEGQTITDPDIISKLFTLAASVPTPKDVRNVGVPISSVRVGCI